VTDIASKLVAPGRLLPGIHGMRGAAAVAIVLFHTIAIVGTSTSSVFDFAGKYFGYSVHLFFVLSAFSLTYSTLPTKNREVWIQNYLIKRFFRIAPLFYFMVAVMIGWALFFRSPLPSLAELLTNVTFTFGLVPPYTGGLVWGSWAIGVEVLFYAIFPVLLVISSSLRASFWLLTLTGLASFSIGSMLHEQYLSATPQPPWDPSYFAFGSNSLFFAFGIWAFYLRARMDSSTNLLRVARLLAVILLLGLLFGDLASYLRPYGRLDLAAWGVCFALLCATESLKPSMVMANRVMEYFGERSFSIYLVHPPVLVLAKAKFEVFRGEALPLVGSTATAAAELIIAVIMILPLAEITYRLIEVPGINVGKAVIKSMSAKRRGDNLVRP
jgi:peptidoglycan/LPS O-acetylase OafA/YrhL